MTPMRAVSVSGLKAPEMPCSIPTWSQLTVCCLIRQLSQPICCQAPHVASCGRQVQEAALHEQALTRQLASGLACWSAMCVLLRPAVHNKETNTHTTW